MRVDKAMHKDVTWVGPETPVRDIAKMMGDQDIGAVPVGENDRLIGMVTDRDIALRAMSNGRDPGTLTARDVMTERIVYCRAEESLEDAIHLMEDKRIRRLPVINKDKRMVGMLSVGDLSHAASQTLTGELMQAVAEHHA